MQRMSDHDQLRMNRYCYQFHVSAGAKGCVTTDVQQQRTVARDLSCTELLIRVLLGARLVQDPITMSERFDTPHA